MINSRSKRLDSNLSLSSERSQQLIEKGMEYRQKVEEKRQAKKVCEKKKCTFSPQINNYTFQSEKFNRYQTNTKNTKI